MAVRIAPTALGIRSTPDARLCSSRCLSRSSAGSSLPCELAAYGRVRALFRLTRRWDWRSWSGKCVKERVSSGSLTSRASEDRCRVASSRISQRQTPGTPRDRGGLTQASRGVALAARAITLEEDQVRETASRDGICYRPRGTFCYMLLTFDLLKT